MAEESRDYVDCEVEHLCHWTWRLIRRFEAEAEIESDAGEGVECGGNRDLEFVSSIFRMKPSSQHTSISFHYIYQRDLI
jgi:hypothetical protein